ncbi:HlyD family efflux transporter periplasmic adaptor subunit [Sinomonas susongensis]|uniref:HlyD family efflux transporter periplasmic adaptor subunit n=1 Tax=Sinomonas susongensis TaxID=1324851 RepID=UPI001BB248FA|nr:HlyD family efflux transporter periplasmic adaptor subunit [Sinomonas susongensis]
MAAVEERIVTSSLSVQGIVSGAPTHEVRFDVPAAGSKQIVTSVLKAPGTPVAVGDLLATVSGIPVFLIPEGIPLYRDMRQGDVGPDVAAFQTLLVRLGYLRGAATGTMDARTLAATGLWYKSSGQRLPESDGRAYVAMEHFAFASGDGSVRQAPAVGQRLEPGKPLFVLSAGQQSVTSRFTVPEADSVKVGTAVTVRASGGASFPGTIASIGPFQSNEASKEQRAGHDVRVELSAQDAAALKESSTVSVTVSGQGKRGPAVPLSAVRQGSQGTFVTRDAERASAGTSPPTRDVPVKILAQEGGWASIDPSPELPVGTKVIVG